MTLQNMQALLTAAREASEGAQAARLEGLPDVIKAITALQSALALALEGEPLRGLKNIGNAGVVFYGAQVRTEPDNKIGHHNDPSTATDYLCLDARGQLVRVYWVEIRSEKGSEWELRDTAITPGYLRLDDIAYLAGTLSEVLPRHVKSARKTEGRYRAVQKLALRVRDVLSEEDTQP